MVKSFNTVEDQASAELEKVENTEVLADNQVKLSDGRVVEMREATGADELIVAAELGDTFQANGGGAIIYQSCLIAKTVKSINGQPLPPLRGYGGYRDFAGSFKSKDWNKIKILYDKLNGDTEGND